MDRQEWPVCVQGIILMACNIYIIHTRLVIACCSLWIGTRLTAYLVPTHPAWHYRLTRAVHDECKKSLYMLTWWCHCGLSGTNPRSDHLEGDGMSGALSSPLMQYASGVFPSCPNEGFTEITPWFTEHVLCMLNSTGVLSVAGILIRYSIHYVAHYLITIMNTESVGNMDQ